MSSQLNKIRHRRFRKLDNDTKSTDDKAVSSYYYPKNNLYTRQEFELLDTIYADESDMVDDVTKVIPEQNEFWPQNKEQILNLSNSNTTLFTKLTWFGTGVLITSLIWLIYFQLSVNAIKTRHQTQFVFHKSAEMLTDKTADKQLTQTLVKNKGAKFAFSLPNFFAKKSISEAPVEQAKVENKTEPSNEVVAETQSMSASTVLTYHVVGNGDSIWTIAKKYYTDPTPENINKIAKANNLRLNSVLSLGNKLVIPQ